MIHLRLVVPADLAEQVLALLGSLSSALNLIHLPEAVRAPEGDLVLVDVAREDASTVIRRLQELGLGERGTIATIEIDAAVSELALAAEQAAAGSPADAVVWEQVEARTSETAVLSGSFLAFMILATLIAAVGIVTDSIILIIGAMIVGPEFGPLAGLCVALVQRRRELALSSLAALLVGFPVAIVVTYAGVVLGRAGSAPGGDRQAHRDALHLRSEPVLGDRRRPCRRRRDDLVDDREGGALIGVLVSVTTIPAPRTSPSRPPTATGARRGAAGQLVINLTVIVAAALVTLAVQRALTARRRL